MPDPRTEDDRNEHDKYVSKINWLIATGRDDLVDEIADQFERPHSQWTQVAAYRPELRRAG